MGNRGLRVSVGLFIHVRNLIIRFSILIPAKNSMPYIQDTVESVLGQSYVDFELIVSDDFSEDGTFEFISELRDPRLRLLRPRERGLSPSEHWEFLGRQATGEWQLFLGHDDGLQPYFFELASRLTEVAERRGIRSVVSNRAHFHWPGVEGYFREQFVRFEPVLRVSRRNTRLQAIASLLNLGSYHSMAQMYTCSIWSKSLIDQVRLANQGRLITSHPEDASLAASNCIWESWNLWTGVPLGWVGTSPKSSGLAVIDSPNGAPVSTNRVDGSYELASAVESSIGSSATPYPARAGSFLLGDNSVYFWQALGTALSVHNHRWAWFLNSQVAVFLLSVTAVARQDWRTLAGARRDLYRDFIERNRLPLSLIIFLGQLLSPFLFAVARLRQSLRKRRRPPDLSSDYSRVTFAQARNEALAWWISHRQKVFVLLDNQPQQSARLRKRETPNS